MTTLTSCTTMSKFTQSVKAKTAKIKAKPKRTLPAVVTVPESNNESNDAIEFLDKHDHQSPIVVITAAADAEQRAKDISAVGWVEKPFDLDVLLKTIKKYEKK